MTTTTTNAAVDEQRPLMYLILNRLKKGNVSIMLRACVAFNVKAVFLCGAVADYTDQQLRMADHGSLVFAEIRRFPSFEHAVAHLRSRPDGVDVHVCGVEIRADAIAVDSTSPPAFVGSTAFVLGSEGDGLSTRHMALCDRFVYIPQFGNGTASLNVAIAGSIVMHRFATWAQYAAQPFDPKHSAKFLVDRSVLTIDRMRNTVAADIIRNARAESAAIMENDDIPEFALPDDDDDHNNNDDDKVEE
jgi:tRNA C32,U32 (ribose-2'-O)-methylase TrmJ